MIDCTSTLTTSYYCGGSENSSQLSKHMNALERNGQQQQKRDIKGSIHTEISRPSELIVGVASTESPPEPSPWAKTGD